MQIIYETRVAPDYQPVDIADKDLAAKTVEAAGAGRIVTFVKDFDGRCRSCAMRVFEDGAWRGVDITGGA